MDNENAKIKIQECKEQTRELQEKLDLIKKSLNIESKNLRLAEIEKLEEDSNFWNDQSKATEIQKEKSLLQDDLKLYTQLQDAYENYLVLQDFVLVDKDIDSAPEALNMFEEFHKLLTVSEKKVLMSGEVDQNNAIVSINAGAGGTESCDWALMLHRMINRWAEDKKYKVKVLDYQYGDSAGIKSSTMMIEGPYAFGNLQSESGIHRLVRISPFDSQSRRHTSFASIYVSPEIDDSIEIVIEDKDIKIDVFRSGGSGGQSVNTTDSAVRITHLPSGIIVNCQNERSQLQNKMFAMKILKSRLYEKALEEKRAKQEELDAQKKEIGWGSQIRSYVLHPYKMVKDHRTNLDVGAAEKVLDGELDPFIHAYLQWKAINQ